MRDLNRGSEWDFGYEKDIILIAFFWIINNCVRNEGKVKPQTWTLIGLSKSVVDNLILNSCFKFSK